MIKEEELRVIFEFMARVNKVNTKEAFITG